MKRIFVYEPWLTGLEKDYAKQAIDSTWISSNGSFIQKAEELLSEYYGCHAIVSNNGTTALHLCCRVAGMKPGDRVLVPSTTYAATAFAPSYCGGKVEFIDADPETWNMDLCAVVKACQANKVDYVIPVHLFGNPVDMNQLDYLAEEYDFTIIEDACESIGATVDGMLTGTLGKIAAISFYGNKTLTSGEGGAVISTNKDLVMHAKMLRGQAQSFDKRYWHLDIGYNYRMTNIQAAILYAQLLRRNEILQEKERVAEQYKNNFNDDKRVIMQKVLDGHHHSYWMIVIKTPIPATELAKSLDVSNIETRPMFYPLDEMPPFKGEGHSIVSNELSEKCLMLPSSPLLDNEEIKFICDAVKKALDVTTSANNCGPV
jgi:perosamine synthetase